MLSESIKEIKSIDCQCPIHCYTIVFAMSTTQYINNKDKSYIPSNSNKTDSPYISPSKVQVDRIINMYCNISYSQTCAKHFLVLPFVPFSSPQSVQTKLLYLLPSPTILPTGQSIYVAILLL